MRKAFKQLFNDETKGDGWEELDAHQTEESRNFHGFFFFQMHSSTTLYAESTIVVQMLCKLRFVSKCLNQKLCEFKV